jgi:hypothetical protein
MICRFEFCRWQNSKRQEERKSFCAFGRKPKRGYGLFLPWVFLRRNLDYFCFSDSPLSSAAKIISACYYVSKGAGIAAKIAAQRRVLFYRFWGLFKTPKPIKKAEAES